ncbi:hypothetical protein AURDEDRAFT_183247 [Auricularia subglabra TFB-10046 SS5]|nr:hypothetical protein AURDEDRAFT_183247 [Auricularia subglabra TFB-10046 SS5]
MARLAHMPTDVLDAILTSLPDFSSLRAAALTCRTLQLVYAARTTSIMGAVSRNLVPSDPVLAVALRGVRVELERGDNNYAELEEALGWYTEQNALDDPISWPEALELEARVRRCYWMEVLFSQDCKHRLSHRDSEALNKALHRLWLFSDVLRTESGRNPWPTYETRKKWFYNHLSNQDLYNLEVVRAWLTAHLRDIDKQVDPHKLLIYTGVNGFPKIYMDDDYDYEYYEEELVDFEWEEDLVADWEERDLDWDRGEDDSGLDGLGIPPGVTPLQVQVVSANIICKKCTHAHGFSLWNCHNWQYIRPLRDVRRLKDYLIGELRWNSGECDAMLEHILFRENALGFTHYRLPPPSQAPNPIRTPEILRALFALPGTVASRQLQQVMFKDDFLAITKEDWLCVPCIKELLRQRLWIWWYNEKAMGRVAAGRLQRNCRYGYECRTQRGNLEHAKKFNHLWINTAPEDDKARPPRPLKRVRDDDSYTRAPRRYISMYNPFEKSYSYD